METFPSYQSHQAPYQSSPYASESRNDILPDPNYTNETDYTNVLSSNRFNHSLSYPPASGRFPRNHEFQAARARSHLQTRTSPPPAVEILSRSPVRQNEPGPVSNLSAFPLPFRPQPTTHHLPLSTENPSPIISLTSRHVRSYYSPPFQASSGRLFGFDNDSHVPIGSASLPDKQISGSNIDTGYSISRGWQIKDTKWPQSRPQTRRKYTFKGRRYDSPVNQRRLGPGHFNLHSAKNPSWFSTQANGKRAQNSQKNKHSGLLYDKDTQKISNQAAQSPRLARHPFRSDSLDDDYDDDDASVSNRLNSTCVSQYISSETADNSVQPIRESKYWVQMKDDPIFSNLSGQTKLISIEELVKRRAQILQDHVHVPRQTIMKEQGTQTYIESSAFLHPKYNSNTTGGKDRMALDSIQVKREQTTPPLPPPFQHPQSPREKSHGKQGKRHYRTASLTDPDTPRFHTQQPTRVNSLKRSRSDTEDESKRDSYHRRRRSGIDSTPLSPSSDFSRRPRTSFYRRR